MRKLIVLLISFSVLVSLAAAAYGQSNLLPKYGSTPKNAAQLKADREFLAMMDQRYGGDRKKAAEDAARRGWQHFQQGDTDTSMKRFNQAWLLDHKNASALWGMASVQGSAGKMKTCLELFSEAELYAGGDIDFAVDHARAIGFAAVATRDEKLLQDAFKRYETLYQKAPQHLLNLQNWAIVLYSVGRYAEAWQKIKLAEQTPRSGELDKRFIADLQSRMPRPK